MEVTYRRKILAGESAIRAYVGSSLVEEVENKGGDHADNNAGHDGEMKRIPFTLDVNISGQSTQRSPVQVRHAEPPDKQKDSCDHQPLTQCRDFPFCILHFALPLPPHPPPVHHQNVTGHIVRRIRCEVNDGPLEILWQSPPIGGNPFQNLA